MLTASTEVLTNYGFIPVTELNNSLLFEIASLRPNGKYYWTRPPKYFTHSYLSEAEIFRVHHKSQYQEILRFTSDHKVGFSRNGSLLLKAIDEAFDEVRLSKKHDPYNNLYWTQSSKGHVMGDYLFYRDFMNLFSNLHEKMDLSYVSSFIWKEPQTLPLKEDYGEVAQNLIQSLSALSGVLYSRDGGTLIPQGYEDSLTDFTISTSRLRGTFFSVNVPIIIVRHNGFVSVVAGK